MVVVVVVGLPVVADDGAVDGGVDGGDVEGVVDGRPAGGADDALGAEVGSRTGPPSRTR